MNHAEINTVITALRMLQNRVSGKPDQYDYLIERYFIDYGIELPTESSIKMIIVKLLQEYAIEHLEDK